MPVVRQISRYEEKQSIVQEIGKDNDRDLIGQA